MLLRIVAGVCAAMLAFNATAQHRGNGTDERYLCIADAGTGFFFDAANRRWRSTTFSVEGKRYIIRRPIAGRTEDHFWHEDPRWVIEEIGATMLSNSCPTEFTEYEFLTCEASGDTFTFNRRSMRFQKVYPIGYVVRQYPQPSSEGGDTPSIFIGRCSRLS